MKIIVVDDHSLFRSGLVNLFNSQNDFEVVGEAGTIQETLALVETRQPDLIVMDVGLLDGSAVDATSKILQKKPNVDIVFLTIHASEQLAFAALRLGAKGFLLKDIAAPALLNALRGLRRGELAVSRLILSHYIRETKLLSSVRTGERISSDSILTFREMQMITELSTGDSNREIAQRLSISENTVKVHVHDILRKLKLNSRQEVAEYARRHGLAREILKQSTNGIV
jgi:two-component system nitrate/nitrite response regulator NarL